MTTTTLDGITNDHVIRALRLFGWEKITKDGSLESWVNLAADRLEKAESESESRRVALVAMIKANNKLEAEVKAYRKLAMELIQELVTKCDDPIHAEQLKELET